WHLEFPAVDDRCNDHGHADEGERPVAKDYVHGNLEIRSAEPRAWRSGLRTPCSGLEKREPRGPSGFRGSPKTASRSNCAGLAGAGLADLRADVGEGVVGVGAQSRDGSDAHHDDQGQHDSVLDRGRAALVLQETYQAVLQVLHGLVLSNVKSR